MSDFVIVTGLSGAGRTQAAHSFEDLGWYVIDNLPPNLIGNVAEMSRESAGLDRVVLVTGGGGYGVESLLPEVEKLRASGDSVRTLYLEASTEELVKRYESTRRRHPFPVDGGVTEAIEAERAALEEVKAVADIVLDTSDLNVHHLRNRVQSLFGSESPDAGMRITIESFGFKHGLPRDVDMVIDCRFLPNPHWEEDLRPLSGLDEPVRDYVLGQGATEGFIERLESLLDMLLPAYVREGKSYFTLAFGCTGGRHRAVAITEYIAGSLKERGYDPTIVHRDKDK